MGKKGYNNAISRHVSLSLHPHPHQLTSSLFPSATHSRAVPLSHPSPHSAGPLESTPPAPPLPQVLLLPSRSVFGSKDQSAGKRERAEDSCCACQSPRIPTLILKKTLLQTTPLYHPRPPHRPTVPRHRRRSFHRNRARSTSLFFVNVAYPPLLLHPRSPCSPLASIRHSRPAPMGSPGSAPAVAWPHGSATSLSAACHWSCSASVGIALPAVPATRTERSSSGPKRVSSLTPARHEW